VRSRCLRPDAHGRRLKGRRAGHPQANPQRRFRLADWPDRRSFVQVIPVGRNTAVVPQQSNRTYMSDPQGTDRWRQELAFAIAVSLACWSTAVAVVALFQPPRWVSILLLLGALALTLLSAALAYRQQRRDAAEQAAAWEATLETALPAGLRLVRQTNPYEALLVAPASRALRHMRPDEPRPPYVERDADVDINKGLGRRRGTRGLGPGTTPLREGPLGVRGRGTKDARPLAGHTRRVRRIAGGPVAVAAVPSRRTGAAVAG
jgi:hypothetical protein